MKYINWNLISTVLVMLTAKTNLGDLCIGVTLSHNYGTVSAFSNLLLASVI